MLHRAASAKTLAGTLARVNGSHLATPCLPQQAWLIRTRNRRLLAEVTAGQIAPSAAESAVGLHRRSDELARVEAALFLAREPLSTRRLARLARLPDGTRARALVRELRKLQEASGAAIRVEHVAGGFQLFTRAAFGPWLKRMLDAPPSGRLSATALETLAIVAYRQPVTRAEIEAIRGVGSEDMLRQLMERDLVAIGGRVDDLGRPNVYVTTRRFLAAFGLPRIEDLPPIEAVPPSGTRADDSVAGEATEG